MGSRSYRYVPRRPVRPRQLRGAGLIPALVAPRLPEGPPPQREPQPERPAEPPVVPEPLPEDPGRETPYVPEPMPETPVEFPTAE